MPTTKQNNEFACQIIQSDALDIAVDYISKNLNPQDVFSESDLSLRAESNGFVKE